MSIITSASSSLRVMIGSIDGTLGVRTHEPIKLANNFMLGRYLTTPQRYEFIATGHFTTTTARSPGDDIKKMGNKLGEIVARAPGNGS